MLVIVKKKVVHRELLPVNQLVLLYLFFFIKLNVSELCFGKKARIQIAREP